MPPTQLVTGKKLRCYTRARVVGYLATPGNRVDDTQISTFLPNNLPPATYLVTVSNGTAASRNDVMDVAIGAVGPRVLRVRKVLPGQPAPSDPRDRQERQVRQEYRVT